VADRRRASGDPGDFRLALVWNRLAAGAFVRNRLVSLLGQGCLFPPSAWGPTDRWGLRLEPSESLLGLGSLFLLSSLDRSVCDLDRLVLPSRIGLFVLRLGLDVLFSDSF
jgi:hypothetical protein